MYVLHAVLNIVHTVRRYSIPRRIPLALVFWGVFFLAMRWRWRRRRIPVQAAAPAHTDDEMSG